MIEPRRRGCLQRLAEEYHHTVAIRAECYAGYRAQQEPRAFWCGERRLEVRAVVDRWFAPAQRWFKVDAEDGDVYILRHDEASDEWEIAAYRAQRARFPE
jgi:hypothetical protein